MPLPGQPPQWPFHYQDWADIGRLWDFDPAPSDLAINALLVQLVADFAEGRGVMPASWGWPPVTPESRPTLVLAQDGGGVLSGGVRVEESWKHEACQVLGGLGFGKQYWWCD